MSVAISIISLGLPAAGALVAWAVALHAWRAARSHLPLHPEGRQARGRVITLILMPTFLILFGFVILSLVLGEQVPDATAWPAALSYGVPGLLSGVGMAIIYHRGVAAAAASNRGFGHVMSLAAMSGNAGVSGAIVSLLLITGGSNSARVPWLGLDPRWLAAMLSMVGSLGGPMGSWLAASEWDFRTAETWPRVRTKATRVGILMAALLVFALVVLNEWLIVLLLVLLFGVFPLVAWFARARRRRQQMTKD